MVVCHCEESVWKQCRFWGVLGSRPMHRKAADAEDNKRWSEGSLLVDVLSFWLEALVREGHILVDRRGST